MDPMSPLAEQQFAIVESVLDDIGAAETPRLIVPNKTDVAESLPIYPPNGHEGLCPISARTGAGIENLLETIGRLLDRGKQRIHLTLPQSETVIIPFLRARGRVLAEEYGAGRREDHRAGDGEGLGAAQEAGGRQGHGTPVSALPHPPPYRVGRISEA